jgi:hypothetical protein
MWTRFDQPSPSHAQVAEAAGAQPSGQALGPGAAARAPDAAGAQQHRGAALGAEADQLRFRRAPGAGAAAGRGVLVDDAFGARHSGLRADVHDAAAVGGGGGANQVAGALHQGRAAALGAVHDGLHAAHGLAHGGLVAQVQAHLAARRIGVGAAARPASRGRCCAAACTGAGRRGWWHRARARS